MAHIFFKRLERRYSTQSLISLAHVPSADELEKWIGQSIQNQTKISQPLYPWSSLSHYSPLTVYNPYTTLNPYTASWSQFVSSIFPGATYSWPSWNDNWSSWSSPLSSWLTPRPSWTVSLFPWISSWTSPTIPSVSTPSGTTTQPTPYPPGTYYGLIKRSNIDA